MDTYNTIISLGDRCTPATWLKRFQYRREAYPFDWLGTYDLSVVNDILKTEFHRFFEYDNLIVRSMTDKYAYVEDVFHNINHSHAFSPEEIIENRIPIESYRRVSSMYEKRIGRLLDILQKGQKRIIFLRQDTENRNEFRRTESILSEKYPSLVFRFVIVNCVGLDLKLCPRLEWSENRIDYYTLPVHAEAKDKESEPIWRAFFAMLPFVPIGPKIF